MTKVLKKCLQVGVDFLGAEIIVEEFSKTLEGLFLELGVRRINKFWSFENSHDFDSLDGALNPV